MPIISLDEAICLTLDGRPNDVFFREAHKRRYLELERLVASHRVAGSLQFLNNNQIHAIDWLNWLGRVEIEPPKEWQPVGITDTVGGPCWEDAVKIAIEMRDDPDIGKPRTQDQLYEHILKNRDRCPNCCPPSVRNWDAIKQRVYRERKDELVKDPLKDPRFSNTSVK